MIAHPAIKFLMPFVLIFTDFWLNKCSHDDYHKKENELAKRDVPLRQKLAQLLKCCNGKENFAKTGFGETGDRGIDPSSFGFMGAATTFSQGPCGAVIGEHKLQIQP